MQFTYERSFESLTPITPNDGADLSPIPNALSIGTSGTLSVVDLSGNTVNLGTVPAGVLRVRVKRVRSTGTTASNIVGLS